MTGLRSGALRQLALMFIAREAGSDVDAAAIAAPARRAYEALVRVLTPLIGARGVHALTGRAVCLAARERSWLGNTHEPEPASEAFDHIQICVERRDPASVADGAAAILAMIGTLLVSLIGEGLTLRLLQEAWPTGVLEPEQEHM